MNEPQKYDGLVTGILRYQKECRNEGGRELFHLPFPGKLGIVPHEIARKFPDLDAAFGATISMSLSSEYAAMITSLANAIGLCESAIEARLLMGLVCACAVHQLTISIRTIDDVEVYDCMGIHGDMVLTVTPQRQIGSHRVDFGLVLEFTHPAYEMARLFGGDPPKYVAKEVSQKLAVECDGHEFHEKTPQQAARDKSRDRDLLGCGYPVMRFTGSEIYRDPLKCGDQIVHDYFEINKLPDERITS